MFFERKSNIDEFEAEALPHWNDLYRTALSQLKDEALAEDVLQEAHLKAWKSFHQFRKGSNCRAWLFRIMFNCIHDHHRQWFSTKTVNEPGEGMEGHFPYAPPIPDGLTDEDVVAGGPGTCHTLPRSCVARRCRRVQLQGDRRSVESAHGYGNVAAQSRAQAVTHVARRSGGGLWDRSPGVGRGAMNVIDFGQARLQEGRGAVGRLSRQRTLGGVRTGYRRARTSLPGLRTRSRGTDRVARPATGRSPSGLRGWALTDGAIAGRPISASATSMAVMR